jgi:adenosylmethionine-8-amino-7-oxononanoate aminotransferase
MAVRGEGVYLYDADGNQYLDGSGGAAVSCLGHGHPGVIAAIKEQLDRLAYAHTSFFTNEPQERLAADLADRFGPRDSRVYFLSGGSEANETALKLVRQYWVAHGQAGKGIIISRNQSYHGNTLGALSLSGNPQRRELYGPLLKNWPKTEPCYEYRHRQRDESREGYALRSADSLEQLITEHGAENIAAFFAETVVGATLGAVPAVPGYFRRIREICDQHDILLVLDEVMSGSGRTGSYFAFEQEGVVPDIVTIAKGLAGGYQPLGAAIVRGFVHDRIVDASGAFSHGHTYVGHATACAAGLAVSDIVRREGLVEKVAASGPGLQSAFREALADHPHVGDIRGRGYFVGIELVQNRETKEPPAADVGLPETIRRIAMEKGLLCYPSGGTADGRDGAHILLAPPYICSDSNIDELVSKIKDTLDEVSF